MNSKECKIHGSILCSVSELYFAEDLQANQSSGFCLFQVGGPVSGCVNRAASAEEKVFNGP